MWQPKNIRVGNHIKFLNMKKILLLVVVLLVMVAFNIQAQISVGATIGAQMPIGTFGDGMKTGFGFNVVGKYMLKENMAVGLNLGYQGFGVKGADEAGVSASSSMVPITGLFEYHFNGSKVKPYIGADLGIYRFSVKAEAMGFSATVSEMYFGFAPTAGILYELSDKISFLGNLKFNYVAASGDAATWLGINAGIVYKIK